MPFVDDYAKTIYVDEDVTPTGTPDVSAANMNNHENGIKELYTAMAAIYTAHEALDAEVSAIPSAFADTTFITGLELEWVSVAQIRVKSGACWIPAASGIATATGDTTLTPTLTANAWYYVYALNVNGLLSFVVNATAPTLYRGTAKHKTGDSSQRYIGAIRTNASSQIYKFVDNAQGDRLWLENLNDTLFRVWNSTSTPVTIQNVDCSSVVPPLVKMAHLTVMNYVNAAGSGTGRALYLGTSDMQGTLSATNWMLRSEVYDFSTQVNDVLFPLNASRQLQLIANNAGSHESAIRARGYREEK